MTDDLKAMLNHSADYKLGSVQGQLFYNSVYDHFLRRVFAKFDFDMVISFGNLRISSLNSESPN